MSVRNKLPEPGWATEAEIISAHDGDTITVEIKRTIHIRIRDLMCKELNDGGKAAADFVQQYIGKECLLFIPSNDPLKLMDFNSFERIVGDIYIDKKSLRDILIQKKLGKPGSKMGW